MKKSKTTKLAVSVKKTAPVQGLVRKPTYHNLADRKKVINNGLFHNFPARRKKHSINGFAQNKGVSPEHRRGFQQTQQVSAGKAFYREAGRKVKLSKANALLTPGRRSIDSLAGYKLYFGKKLWYYDKRAPIPGGNAKLSTGFRRKNKFYKKIIASYVVFKKYLGFNKKAIAKELRNMSTPHGNLATGSPLNNRLLMHMDSLFHSTMCKSGLMLNPYQNKIRQSYTLNGKAVRKKNFVLKHGNKAFLKDRDFCLYTFLSLKGALLPLVEGALGVIPAV